MAKEKVLTSKDVAKLFINSMKKVAKALEVDPSELTAAQFRTNDPNEIQDWDMRKIGGFTAAKKMYFEKDHEGEDVRQGSKLVAAHRNKLEKKYGTEDFYLKEVQATLLDVVNKADIKLHKPLKETKAKKAKKERTIVAHLSDTHYGANISKNEMDNANEFNWEIAARRTALFMEQIANYKPQYRGETELVLCVNGDIIAGQIHNQEWFVDLLTTQFAGTLSILSQAISYGASKFAKVRVVCTPGNHGRNVGKADKGRATTHKWDSYENMIYVALREMFKANKNVEIIIPEAPYAIFDVQGHKFFQTHGDTVVNVGNPGSALNMSSINNQINKINASLPGSKKIAGLLVGHVHTPTIQLTESGCMLLINGCLSGTDPFAQSIGIFESNPTQLIFEVTKQHAVGDIRLIQVKSADKRKDLDAIISPMRTKF